MCVYCTYMWVFFTHSAGILSNPLPLCFLQAVQHLGLDRKGEGNVVVDSCICLHGAVLYIHFPSRIEIS